MNKFVFVHRMGPEMASFRYRSAIPAQQLGASINGGEGHVYIFSKPVPADLILAKECKDDGVKVVVDIGDDHYQHPLWGPLYREMIALADAVVTPTTVMADRTFHYTKRKVDAVIGDPYEEALTPPHANRAERLLWCGNPSNLKDLDPYLRFLEPWNLTIVTGTNPRKDFPYLPWSIETQATELRKANIVLLPHRKGMEYKSPNRVVNAMRAGCFVVGSTHPSHYEFRRYIWNSNLYTGLIWAQHFKDELDDMVAEGQTYCEKYSPETIGAEWKQLLDSLCG